MYLLGAGVFSVSVKSLLLELPNITPALELKVDLASYLVGSGLYILCYSMIFRCDFDLPPIENMGALCFVFKTYD